MTTPPYKLIDTPQQLIFKPVKGKSVYVSKITFKNTSKTKTNILFKLSSSSRNLLHVKPSKGSTEPGETTTIMMLIKSKTKFDPKNFTKHKIKLEIINGDNQYKEANFQEYWRSYKGFKFNQKFTVNFFPYIFFPLDWI